MTSIEQRTARPRGASGAAFGVAAVVALAAIAAVFVPSVQGGKRSAAEQEDAPLIGYAPSAPATGAMLRYDVEYPAIPYTTGERRDPVAALIDRIERGEAELAHDGERGYLESLLA